MSDQENKSIEQQNDNDSVSFKDINDINLDDFQQSDSHSPDVMAEVEEIETMSVNSHNVGSVPVIEATSAVQTFENNDELVEEATSKPATITETPEKSSVTKRVIPALEAEIASDAKKAKDSGTTVELFNTLNVAMADLIDNLQKANPLVDKLKNVLDHIEFDPNTIEISENTSDPMVMHNQLELLKAARPDPVYPIIALKSGFKADIAALNNNDKIELRNLSGSGNDQTMKLLKLIHSKIRSTSIGKISFTRFLEVTAEEDYETLIYGLFSASFPNATEYNMNCPHCRTEVKLPLYPSQLIEVIDKEKAGAYVKQVLDNYDKGEDFLKSSLVNTKNRVTLPKSKAVVELITPTLKNMLDSNRLTEDAKTKYNPDLINLAKYIKAIYILNIDVYQSTGRITFMPLKEIGEILSFISNGEAADLSAIRKAVSKLTRSYAIQYRIPNFNCPSNKCAKEIENVNVDMTELLFFGIVGELTT